MSAQVEAVAVLVAQCVIVGAFAWSAWVTGSRLLHRLRKRKAAKEPEPIARVGDQVSIVLESPAQPQVQTSPTPPSIPAGMCKCCRARPATKARPFSAVPWLDTVEWLNRSARLHSMPRRWIVEQPHVSSDHPAEFCQGCEVIAVKYLENGHAGFRADNQKAVQKQDRLCAVLNAGMDAELDRHEQEVAADAAAMLATQGAKQESPQLSLPVTQATQVVG